MVRKKLDSRIRILIENNVSLGHRSMFLLLGDKGKDQIVILHHILTKATFKARPTVLWCYKKELGFTSHRKKRMRQIQKKIRSGKLSINEEDPFELFIASTQIRYCYYSETHKILGNTFGMCILQDFEALNPNLLARTIETVEGGGLVIILLKSLSSLRQFCAMTMDVHSRYRTQAHQEVVGRFNERFILSLGSCQSSIVMDDQLNILPISSHVLNMQPRPPKSRDELSPNDLELQSLKETMSDTQPVSSLLNQCKTLDQGKVLLKLLDIITEKTLKATVSLTAARGRGKSAALGLAIAGAVGFGYSNIFVTSPSPENLKTLFEFVMKGLDALEYEEHVDYELIQSSNPEFSNAVVRLNVFRDHRQTVQYIHPTDAAKLGQAELVAIDEAAAIPLPLVRQLLGPYLVFLSSTVNGYEGTGRSLSLKLINQLRQQTAPSANLSAKETLTASVTGRTLHELVLEESIRYRSGDQIESWLNQLLCLDSSTVSKLSSGFPSPADCDLYYVNRDALFSFHKASETFLQRLMSIYVSAHYKNTPNDLQMLSDAPAHHLFCLLGPVKQDDSVLPEILCVIQICLEGEISKQNVISSLSRGKRASGDLVPWTLAQQFQDNDFPSLSGARVLRIATHPDYQSMGYGSRALQLLQDYYEGKIPNLNEDEAESFETVGNMQSEEGVGLLEERIGPRRNLPPLLLRLNERRPESLDYLGVSYGLTEQLLKFWKKNRFVPTYLRQTENDLTGEHSCIMIRLLWSDEEVPHEKDWLNVYWREFRQRLVNLLGFQFRDFPTSLALSLLQNKVYKEQKGGQKLDRWELSVHLSDADLRRLELYSQNLLDHHLVTDLLPTVAKLHFTRRLPGVQLSLAQQAILLGIGLQYKTIETMSSELDLPVSQLLALFNRSIKKMVQHLNSICETAIEEKWQETSAAKTVLAEPTKKSLEEDLREGAKEVLKQQERDRKRLLEMDFSEYTIKGTEDDWNAAVGDSGLMGSTVNIKSLQKKRTVMEEALSKDSGEPKPKKKKKRKRDTL